MSCGSVPGPGGFGSGGASLATAIVTGGGGGGGGGNPSPPPPREGLPGRPRRAVGRLAGDFFFAAVFFRAGARRTADFFLVAPRFAEVFFLVAVFLRGDLRAALRLVDLRRPLFFADDFLRDDFFVAFLPALRAAMGTLL